MKKDRSGHYLSVAHMITGINASLNRDNGLQPVLYEASRRGGLKGALAIVGVLNMNMGAQVDNLFATTISGDLGQSAVLKSVGKVDKYIGYGNNVEATYEELVGDIDGFIMGYFIDKNKSLNFQIKNNNIKFRQILKHYYAKTEINRLYQYLDKSNYRNRFSVFDNLVTESSLKQQVQNFSENYVYNKRRTGLTETEALNHYVGDEVDKMLNIFWKWLRKQK